ncbi:MAG: GNAT family N-acetyltransferase [Eubacteriales bacterium]
MDIKYTNGRDTDFIRLCEELDAYLNRLAGGEINRKVYVPLNALDGINDVYVVYEEEFPIACGGFKHHCAGTAEVKRVFVSEAYRNKGIGKHVMRLLEAMAKTKGYKRLIVETGRDMPGANILYQTLGYSVIPNFGPYKNLPNSVCMEKNL